MYFVSWFKRLLAFIIITVQLIGWRDCARCARVDRIRILEIRVDQRITLCDIKGIMRVQALYSVWITFHYIEDF